MSECGVANTESAKSLTSAAVAFMEIRVVHCRSVEWPTVLFIFLGRDSLKFALGCLVE